MKSISSLLPLLVSALSSPFWMTSAFAFVGIQNVGRSMRTKNSNLPPLHISRFSMNNTTLTSNGASSNNHQHPIAPPQKFGPSSRLLELFNRQVTQEFTASQVYLSASIWFDNNDWEGMAAYMLAESAEEREHGLGFVEFANKRNFPIELQAIPAPVSCSEWDSPEDVWLSILELEEANTHSLLELAGAANECNDFAVLAFLNPFHMGQVNEEDKIGSILAKVRDENRTPGLLRSLDAELGSEAGK